MCGPDPTHGFSTREGAFFSRQKLGLRFYDAGLCCQEQADHISATPETTPGASLDWDSLVVCTLWALLWLQEQTLECSQDTNSALSITCSSPLLTWDCAKLKMLL